MANQIIQSIKTIAQSLVDNAGYDKTRGGFIVGVNSVTNTYSVKVDGVTYPIVRAVDDATYIIGDVVKVVSHVIKPRKCIYRQVYYQTIHWVIKSLMPQP